MYYVHKSRQGDAFRETVLRIHGIANDNFRLLWKLNSDPLLLGQYY